MGWFDANPLNEIFRNYDREDCEGILETARAITENDRRVVAAVEAALNDPKKYIKQNASRFSERGIELDGKDIADDLDADELLFLAMLNELETFEYAFEFDCKCSAEDFLWGLTQIKTHEHIKDVLRTIELDGDGDIEKWGKQLNKALGGNAYICYMHIDSDSYPIAVMSPEAFEKIPLPFIFVM